MIEPETFAFLTELAQNNHKVWMDAHREERDDAMRNFTGVAMGLHDYADRFDPAVAEARIKPKQSYTKFFQEPRDRVGREMYRTGIDVFANAGDPYEGFGYYLHVAPGNCHAGAGLFHPSKTGLARVRARLVEDPEGLAGLLEAAEFKSTFPNGLITRKKLGILPDEFDSSGPAAPYLKMLGFGCRHDLADEALLDDEVIDELIVIFRAARDLVRFFD